MFFLRNIRLVLAVAIGVPILAAMAIGAVVTWMFGDGAVHVVAPIENGLRVQIDDAPAVELMPGQHWKGSLGQGQHEVTLTSAAPMATPTTHLVAISSGFHQVLIPSPEQCFVIVEAEDVYYDGRFGAGAFWPGLLDRVDGDEPIDINGHTYFSEDAMPMEIDEGDDVDLVVDVPCVLFELDDDQLREAMGYER